MSNHETETNDATPPSQTKRPAFTWMIVLGLGIVFCVAFYLYIWPNIIGPRNRSVAQRSACINNLRQIDTAKQVWASENNITNLDTVVTWDNIKSYIFHGEDGTFYCPKDAAKTTATSYELGDLKTLPTCKIDASHQIK